MELLLNLIWLALAVGALLAFARDRNSFVRTLPVLERRSLIALACVVVLLFPVVSASDDLHPTQAVMEDASKKVQLAIAPLHLLQTHRPPSMPPAMLAFYLLFALVILRPSRPAPLAANARDGAIVPSAGRAPPSCWH